MSVHLIAGPPGSGRTTYAAALAGPADRVVDLDLIAARVGPGRAQAVRLAAEAGAANYPGDTYVVRTLADGHDRHGVAARIKAATVTVLAVPPEVAAQRIAARDGPGADTTGPAAWWAAYTPHPRDKTIRPTEQHELHGRATVPRETPDKEHDMAETNGNTTPTPAEVAAAIKPPAAPGTGAGEQQTTGTGAPAAPVEKPAATGGNLPRTQEELDRIVGERVAREARKYQGYETYKAAYEQQDARLEQVRAEAADAAARKYGERLARTTVEAAATAAGFHDPSDVLSHVNLADVLQGDQVDTAKVEAQLKDLATAKPYLVASTTGGPQRLRTSKTNTNPEPTKGRGSASMLAAYARGH